jgi:antitoxin component YwqK of YwqJK toxin-antitoxin module
MKVFKMINFIGSKNSNYTYEKIKNELPSKPIDGKGYLDSNDNRQGKWMSRYDYGNGKLVNIGTYRDDKKFGEFEEYFNGKLYFKGSYINGKKEGAWEYYNPVTERLFETGSYKNGEKDDIWYTYMFDKIDTIYTYKNGLYHGEYMIMSPTGGFEIGTYENGKLIKKNIKNIKNNK